MGLSTALNKHLIWLTTGSTTSTLGEADTIGKMDSVEVNLSGGRHQGISKNRSHHQSVGGYNVTSCALLIGGNSYKLQGLLWHKDSWWLSHSMLSRLFITIYTYNYSTHPVQSLWQVTASDTLAPHPIPTIHITNYTHTKHTMLNAVQHNAWHISRETPSQRQWQPKSTSPKPNSHWHDCNS